MSEPSRRSPYALQEANKVKLELPPEFLVEVAVAYKRAQSYTEGECPRCWVHEGHRTVLETRAIARTSKVIGCVRCGFEVAVDG